LDEIKTEPKYMIDYEAFKKESLLPPSSSKSIVEDLKPKVVAEIAKPVSS
jgi:hypothetical protein